MNAEWRPVPGYEGLYSVSSLGEIFSKRSGSNRRLQRRKDGYLAVELSDSGTKRQFLVHTIVARAFIGPWPDGAQVVAHRDGVRDNNVPTNLRYDTHAGNHADKLVHGTHYCGERHWNAKLTDAQVVEIRRAPGPIAAIADKYGIAQSAVSKIKHGLMRSSSV